jgi:hypothetical protein
MFWKASRILMHSKESTPRSANWVSGCKSESSHPVSSATALKKTSNSEPPVLESPMEDDELEGEIEKGVSGVAEDGDGELSFGVGMLSP